MCALFAHECNSFQNAYFVQLLHFKEIKFRTIFRKEGGNLPLVFSHLSPYNRPYAESIYRIFAVKTASRKPFANRWHNSHSSQLTAHSSQLGVANALINGQLFFTHLLIFPHTLLHAAKAAFCFFIKATAGGIRSCLFCAAALRQRSCNYLDQQSFVSNRKHCTVTCRCTRQEEYRILPRMADMNIRYIFIQKEE